MSAPFGFCLNTSTIKGQQLGIVAEVELTAATGYDGIEPWIDELERYHADGGDYLELGRRIADLGLSVEDVIGFFEWAVDDEARRAQALEQLRGYLDLCRAIGAKRLATAPAGIYDTPGVSLPAIAERYRAVLDLAAGSGVVPMVEFWGIAKSLGRLGDCLYVAAEAGHPEACILADVFHIYKSGGSFAGLKLLGPATMGLFHVNDYPAAPARATVTDADRVYPGDGVAPLTEIFSDLRDAGYRGMLSLELFNRDYWTQDAATVAQTGLRKLQALTASL